MIITRSPLRVSLGGGGTDLPSYSCQHGGFLLAGAIDKYVYINVHPRFVDGFLLKYSHLEEVSSIDDIQHPIIREALREVGMHDRNLEITSMADIPAGTGLGSSGSFTTALLKALHAYKKNLIHPDQLAEQACHIEIDILREPIGKQDQYIAAYGGITCFRVQQRRPGEAWPLAISEETLFNLEDNLLLFFTGYSRSASAILKEQDDKSKLADAEMTDNLHFIKELALRSKQALEKGELAEFGRADECPLGAQEAAQRGHEQRKNRSMVRLRHGQRCPRRQADRRRGRRVPDVLRWRQAAAAPCHARAGTQRSQVPLRF